MECSLRNLLPVCGYYYDQTNILIVFDVFRMASLLRHEKEAVLFKNIHNMLRTKKPRHT